MRSLLAGIIVLLSVTIANGSNVDPFHPSAKDVNTTPVVWEKTDWGELGVAQLIHAPFPDDSRTTGYTRKETHYPFATHYNDPSVVLAIPQGFDPNGSIDFIVICHGHMGEARRFVVNSRMGEILFETKRNVILVAPQGPKEAPDSSGGKFEKPGEFANFMNEMMSTLKREGRINQNASLGNILAAGFSGGGRPLGFILDIGGLDDNIKEAWIFDAAYEQHNSFAKHFTSALNTTGPQALRSLYTDHLIQSNAKIMALIGTPNGRPVAVVDDALMEHPTEELTKLMRQHQLLFMHTVMPHNALKMSERFLGPLISTSRFLRSIP